MVLWPPCYPVEAISEQVSTYEKSSLNVFRFYGIMKSITFHLLVVCRCKQSHAGTQLMHESIDFIADRKWKNLA